MRPVTFDNFIGQDDLKRRLSILAQAARGRGETLSHILLAGPPGLGKTTMARIIANMMGAPKFRITTGPALGSRKDLTGLLRKIEPSEVLFIDEIHRVSRAAAELLYPTMEDFGVDAIIGTGLDAVAIRARVGPFTLIGATTRMGRLPAPLRDRFGFIGHLDYYSSHELALIVLQSARALEVHIADDAALLIASRSRGTPRVANKLLRRVRDYAAVYGHGRVDEDVARVGLEVFGVDELGLNKMGRMVLSTIIDRFRGGPVGLGTLAAAVGIAEGTLEDAFEPYLLQRGLIERTPRGRVATPAAHTHMERSH